jgi:UDP-glucuronate decarboxylase
MLENDGRVVSNFIVQALRGDSLTLYGAGDQTRSFCYVDDLAEGLMRLMNANELHEPINLGNPTEFTIKELAAEVIAVCGSKSNLSYPTIQLRQGLEKTVAYFDSRLSQ